MPARNILFLMTDEHTRGASGCYGSHPAHTPHLDALARTGTRFTEAITPSPICVPARASLATGRHVHDIGFWGNAQPYDGSVPSWGHRLRAEGYRTASVGKLHFRDTGDDNGFAEEILPLHVRGGVGWLRGLLRGVFTRWDKAGEFAEQIGPGESDYTTYDRAVAEAACDWLARESRPAADDPFALFVSFVTPHYPLIAPPEHYHRFPLDTVEPPRLAPRDGHQLHPVVDAMREFVDYDAHFDAHGRRVARASYYGLCSFADEQIGRVLKALDRAGRREDTLIVYTSDHGEMLGNHGIWTKCVMYEESVAVPMLLAGPGIPRGQVVDTPTTLLDCYPTMLDAAAIEPDESERALPGRSLVALANGARPARTVLSEYHDGGSITAMFMIRHGRWKYIHYPGYPPELYDLEADPHEAIDRAGDPELGDVVVACETRLREVVDPDAANDAAFADQAALIESHGGVEAILATPDFDFTPIPD